uniref:Uncharacterized protein n=1 Tax=Meloidogyne floridensis TaxID=298350 RepID=A0A915NUG3_9BILA
MSSEYCGPLPISSKLNNSRYNEVYDLSVDSIDNLAKEGKIAPGISTIQKSGKTGNKSTRLKGVLSACLSAYSNAYWSQKYAVLNTNLFLDIISRFVRSDFDRINEKDSNEFLIWILWKLAEDVKKDDIELRENLKNYSGLVKDNGRQHIFNQQKESSI